MYVACQHQKKKNIDRNNSQQFFFHLQSGRHVNHALGFHVWIRSSSHDREK